MSTFGAGAVRSCAALRITLVRIYNVRLVAYDSGTKSLDFVSSPIGSCAFSHVAGLCGGGRLVAMVVCKTSSTWVSILFGMFTGGSVIALP
ncbi:hypothetical protein L195_g055066 [Trifolium pratense]|uniref:Uncharacterized protein n=1 Tax=Trifolium pratense TaxID=57577 RepID=A0A2K3KJB5_TRIPR|nr:hypothetical protein L195_g055066 [Trifolium pratense]